MANEQQHTIVSFDSAYDAFAFKNAASADGIEGRLRTIPREISAGCGTAWDSPPGWHESIEKLIAKKKLVFDVVYKL